MVGDGVFFINESGVYSVIVFKGIVKNFVGVGDLFVVGFIVFYVK